MQSFPATPCFTSTPFKRFPPGSLLQQPQALASNHWELPSTTTDIYLWAFSSFSSGWQGDDAWACRWNVANSSSQSVLSGEITWCSAANKNLQSLHLKTPGLKSILQPDLTQTCRNEMRRQQRLQIYFLNRWHMKTEALNLEICHLEKGTFTIITRSEIQTETGQDGTCALCWLNETLLHIFKGRITIKSANMKQLSINVTQTICGVCGLLTNIE